MLQEQELKTFVEGTTNYFEVAAQQPASIGSPYLADTPPAVHDYTGIISISGKREGVVYFTAPKAMLTVLLMKMQENDFSHETMRDLVGEVANTISGNARRDFGRDFVISALADKATAVEAMEKGANGFLNKPFTDRQLNEAIADLIRE
jgi:chemotaxis protein CheX